MKAILAFLLVAAVNVDSYPFFEHEYERTALGDSIDKASLKLLKEAYNAGDNKNVISSPLGVLMLLSLYSAGSGATSRQEITNALGGSEYKALTKSYVDLSQEFGNMNPDYLTLANKIYVNKGLELNQDFSKTATDYKSNVETIDFLDANKAAGIINKWADETTKGHIKDPVSPDILTPDTVVGLFNIIFFQGHWHVPFEASQTKDKDFHVDNATTVKKPTMYLQQSLFYTESEKLGARMVELPYKENGFRMVVVLPNEVDGLSSVIEKAESNGILEDVFKMEPSGRDVILEMPKFEMKSKLDLNTLLPKVGVSSIFSEPADGIVKSNSVVVSKAFQEAFVKVDEEGATAGAFTGAIAVAVSWPPPPPPKPLEFKIDHPFLFIILNTDKVLFAGTIAVFASWPSPPPPKPLEFKVDHPFLFIILNKDKVLFAGFVAVLLSSNSKPPPPLDFKVDRPFLFLILQKDKILFAGTYTK